MKNRPKRRIFEDFNQYRVRLLKDFNIDISGDLLLPKRVAFESIEDFNNRLETIDKLIIKALASNGYFFTGDEMLKEFAESDKCKVLKTRNGDCTLLIHNKPICCWDAKLNFKQL